MRKLTIFCVIMLLLSSLAGCSSNENGVIDENKEIEQVENMGAEEFDVINEEEPIISDEENSTVVNVNSIYNLYDLGSDMYVCDNKYGLGYLRIDDDTISDMTNIPYYSLSFVIEGMGEIWGVRITDKATGEDLDNGVRSTLRYYSQGLYDSENPEEIYRVVTLYSLDKYTYDDIIIEYGTIDYSVTDEIKIDWHEINMTGTINDLYTQNEFSENWACIKINDEVFVMGSGSGGSSQKDVYTAKLQSLICVTHPLSLEKCNISANNFDFIDIKTGEVVNIPSNMSIYLKEEKDRGEITVNIGVQVMDASDYSEAEEFMDSVNIQYK